MVLASGVIDHASIRCAADSASSTRFLAYASVEDGKSLRRTLTHAKGVLMYKVVVDWTMCC